MDRVRLGRVLGRGARLAARTAYEALDAATSPGPVAAPSASPAARTASAPEILRPSRPAGTSDDPSAHKAADPASSPAQAARAAVHRASQTSRSIAHAGRGLNALEPVKRASRAVSLEVTGSFFALFAFSFAVGAWRFAEQIHSSGQGPYRFAACCVVATVFAWFAISNFVRAKRL